MVSFSYTLHIGSCRLAITLLYTPSHSKTQTEGVLFTWNMPFLS